MDIYCNFFILSLSVRWVREFLNEENKGLDVLVEYRSLHSMLSRKSTVIVLKMNTMNTMAPFTQAAAVSLCGSDCLTACSERTRELCCVCVCGGRGCLESVHSLFTEIRSSHKISFTTNRIVTT